MDIDELLLVSVDDRVAELPRPSEGHLPVGFPDLAPTSITPAAGIRS